MGQANSHPEPLEGPELLEHPPNLLLDLPGPAFSNVWTLLVSKDKSSMFQTSRRTRDRVLGSVRTLGFKLKAGTSANPGLLALLGNALSRQHPLDRLILSYGTADQLQALLQAGASDGWHATVHELQMEASTACMQALVHRACSK